jgi:hypothetical protein
MYLEKNPSQKRADEVAEGVGPEFKPLIAKKKKKVGLGDLVAHGSHPY